MLSAIRKLMPSRSHRRASESVSRRQRLGVETLDERCLPSVTTSLSNGILSINADQNTTSAIVTDWNGQVAVSDQNFHVYTYKDSQVQKMVFNAGNNAMADYSLTNYTNINTDYYTGPGGGTDSGGGGVNRFYAGTGGATCLGGAGTNYFYDNANSIGGDYQAGSGTNVLYKVGPYSYLQTQDGVTPGPMFTVGLLSGIYNSPQLLNDSAISGTSSITAYLNSSDTVLTFSGPIGGGFQIDGNWTDTLKSAGNGLYTHNFSSTGTDYLVTGIPGSNGQNLSIPIPSSQAITVTTLANNLTDPIGTYNGIQLFGKVPLTTDSFSNNSTFSELMNLANLSFSNTGLSWGIALGSNLSYLNLPLLADVPYLYETSNSGMQIDFGGHMSANTAGEGSTVVIDPADPAIYVSYNNSQIGTFSGGISYHGDIPYVPSALPTGQEPPELFGNLYTSAAGIALGDLPVSVSGSMVLSLNANHDGAFWGLLQQAGTQVKTMLDGGHISTSALPQLEKMAGEVSDDIAVGFNGTVSVTAGKGISLSMDAAEGSLYYTQNADGSHTAAFDIQEIDPFAGTFLAQFAPSSTAEIGGWMQSGTGGSAYSWGFIASVHASTFMQFQSDSLTIQASSATNSATVSMDMKGLFGLADFSVTGTVNLLNGNFSLSETGYLNLTFDGDGLVGSETFTFSCQNGNITMSLNLDGSLSVGGTSLASVDGTMYFEKDSGSNLVVWGSGEVDLGHTKILGFDFNNNGFSFDVFGHEVRDSW